MRQIRLAPSGLATVGSGVANGLNQAIQNAMRMKYQRDMMEVTKMRYHAQQTNADSLAAYREAMGKAAGNKTGGTEITPEFIAAAQALGIRPEYLGQFSGGTPGTQPGGSGMTQDRYLDQKVNGAAPSLQGSVSPMGLPTQPVGGGSPVQPQAASPASASPNTNLSYGQRQLLEKMGSAQALAQRGIPGAQASMYGADQRLQGIREGNYTKEQLMSMAAQQKQDHDAFMGQINQALQGMKNQGSAKVAQINASRPRGGAGAGAGTTPADKAGIAQLNGVNKQLLDAQKVMANPTHGIEGVVLSPEQQAQRQSAAKAQYDKLLNDRETVFQNFPRLRGSGMNSQQPSSTGSTPATPANSQSGIGPLRIYQPSESHQAPAGALIQLPNGNVHKVLEAHPGGDPTISSQPVQMAPQQQAQPTAQSQPISVAVPGQGSPPAPPSSSTFTLPWAQ